jgi:hypothetical protein
MNINNAFPSDYLKASDLGNKAVTVTIESVELVDIGQGRDKEQKVLIRFIGKQKGLITNKTNANTIGKLYGPETDGWIGHPITLEAREVEFAGEMVWAIRVSLQKPVATPANSMPTRPAPAANPVSAPIAEDEHSGDPDVPF